MPNWNYNQATFSHKDPAMIEKIVKSNNDETLFSTFVPMPEEEAENWYHWNIENWGTKWDANCYDGVEVDKDNPNSITLGFDTAWSPPIEFYNRMVEQGFEVEAFYYEPGMMFCGQYINGADDCYTIEGDSTWVEENIPEEINEAFAIAENMSEYEEEDEQE